MNMKLLKLLERTVEDDECWVWQGRTDRHGYGNCGVASYGTTLVHRAVYLLMGFTIPDGTELDHICRNRTCCNPMHLEPVTHRVNTLRGQSFAAVNAALTHCAYGHEFTPENTRIYHYPTYTKRICRICDARRQREMRTRRAA